MVDTSLDEIEVRLQTNLEGEGSSECDSIDSEVEEAERVAKHNYRILETENFELSEKNAQLD